MGCGVKKKISMFFEDTCLQLGEHQMRLQKMLRASVCSKNIFVWIRDLLQV